ncbi:hypothetical protein S1361_34155 [Streptomyces cyanogenus]|uniref:Uncharacterized protein n=1 Tax=Streptomyces cyanogenus TaxID=80860 RepID=A0ABX7U067_STRCY|nr:hypothetical protein S1361_34155 [Streptomyces cyanogenus]
MNGNRLAKKPLWRWRNNPLRRHGDVVEAWVVLAVWVITTRRRQARSFPPILLHSKGLYALFRMCGLHNSVPSGGFASRRISWLPEGCD